MEKENKKSCTDCEFFIQHYRKELTCYHKILNYGHCTKKLLTSRFRKTDKICELFEEKDVEIIESAQLKAIAALLTDIAKRIANLQEIFKE